MNVDSFHKTFIKILIVIWISGVAIVATDLFILDKEKKAWNELKPIAGFVTDIGDDNDEITELRAQHNYYMAKGVLPTARPSPIGLPPAPENEPVDDNKTDGLAGSNNGITIEDIILAAKQAELAGQIEPASGPADNVFIPDGAEQEPEDFSSDNAREVAHVIHDLSHDHDGDVIGDSAANDTDLLIEDDAQMIQSQPPEKKEYSYIEPSGKTGRVVIIIDDMGLTLRSKQVEVMKGPLTLAYLPYADGLEERTKRAANNGHELMVHMPMEAMNTKLDGGPKVLRTTTSDQEFLEILDWGLSQFDGYVGINNHMGSRLTKDSNSMNKLMSIIKDRGIYFIDSKTIGSSVAGETAAEYGVPYAVRDVFLDHEISKDFVRGALKKLEGIAKKKGYAIAIGHPHKETIEVLKEWIPTLSDKGLILVPASDVIKMPIARHNESSDDLAVNETY